MISTRSQIATACRYANVVYSSLPNDEVRDEFAELWLNLERTVTTAETAGDDLAVTAAIDRWRSEVMDRFGGNK